MTKPIANRQRFTVEVTEADIERAQQNNSYKCVVAQAVARTIPDATRIEVDTQSIRFTSGGERHIYLTPFTVQGYVIAYDAGDPIEPFRFQLRDSYRVARKQLTPEGKAADQVTRATRRSATTARPKADGSVAAAAPPLVAEPHESPTAAYEVAAKKTVSDRGGPKAPPRVFKKKQRSYGHRLLRINQEGNA